MPWEVTGPVRERTRFIETYLTGFYTITELAERFGMGRQNLHKWLARHNVDGMRGLADHSRAPLHIPHRTQDDVPRRSSLSAGDSRTWDRGRSGATR